MDINEIVASYQQNPDPLLLEQIFEAETGLLFTMAKRYCYENEDFDDVLQIAYMSICYSAKTYREDMGCKFSSYAAKIARWYIFRAREQRKFRIDLDYCSPITHDNFNSILGLNPSELDSDYEDREINGQNRVLLEKVIESLPDRLATIIRLRYGLDSEPLTCREVAKQMGISKQRVNQLEQKALKLLKEQLNDK